MPNAPSGRFVSDDAACDPDIKVKNRFRRATGRRDTLRSLVLPFSLLNYVSEWEENIRSRIHNKNEDATER